VRQREREREREGGRKEGGRRIKIKNLIIFLNYAYKYSSLN